MSVNLIFKIAAVGILVTVIGQVLKHSGREEQAFLSSLPLAAMEKKLYKSNQNKMLDGVCGGIAEYFGIDPTVVRLIWALFSLMGGCGILAYIIAAIIIPRNPVC